MGVVLSGCDNSDIEPMNVSMQAVPVAVMDMSAALCITTRGKVVIPQMAMSSSKVATGKANERLGMYC